MNRTISKSSENYDSFKNIMNTIRLTGFHYLLVSVILLPISIYCNHVFLKAEIFHLTSGYPDPGFTNLEWFHLLVATYAYPIGLMTLIIFMIHAFKSRWSKVGKVILFHILFWVSIYCTYSSHQMADSLLSCGVFCFFEKGKPAPPDTVLGSGQQWLGMLYFFTSLMFVFGIFIPFVLSHIQLYIAYKNKSYDDDSSHERTSVLSLPLQGNGYPGRDTIEEDVNKGIKETLVPLVPSKPIRSSLYFVLMIAVFLIMYPILIFACMALPTWWNNFTPNKIQAYRSINPSDNLGDDPENYYIYLKIGSYYFWNLGSEAFPQFIFLFPDIIMYYTMIYFIVVVTLLSELYPPLRALLLSSTSYTRVSYISSSAIYDYFSKSKPLVWTKVNFCVGEVLVGTLLMAFLVCLFIYFYHDHGWQNGTLSSPTVNNTENAARCMGQVANAVTGLLILPVSRNSIWSLVFGIPGEAMIAYHKMMGILWFVVVFAHMFLWWTNFDQNGFFPTAIFHVPSPYHNDNFTIPLSILTFFIAIILMGVFSNSWVRKYHHELFYWSHHFSLILFFVILWHATMSWYYITAGLILYAIDHMIRFSRCIGITTTLEYANVIDSGDSSVVFLSYKAQTPSIFSLTKAKSLSYEMGQYVFINIPSISIAEWHPFTISSAPNDNVISHHIKSQGRNQWTGKLHEYINSMDRVMSTTPFKQVTINIDGPYGLPLQVSQYSSILLVAGGIGITPMHSCLRQIYTTIKSGLNSYPNLRRVRLVWVTKINEKMFDYTWNMVLSDSMIGNGSNKLFSCAKYFTNNGRNATSNALNAQRDVSSQNSSNANSVNSLVSSINSSATSSNSSCNFYEYCEVYNGRPNLEREIFDSHSTGLTCVYACGPKPLIESCEEISLRFSNLHFKKEYFDL